MIRDFPKGEWPELLHEIPDRPTQLRLWGVPPVAGNKYLAVVGSRKYTTYGRDMCRSIILGLRGEPITIISGLALGIDSIAHRSAMDAGLQTIAIPGSGLDRSVLHPRSHVGLAEEIVASGGGLISEMDDTQPAGVWAFPKRNRIMAGMSHAILIVEAERKSGTLITSRLATEYNRDVGAIPGPLTSPTSDGPHMLMRMGAAVIRDESDVLELLGLHRKDEDRKLLDVAELSSEENVFIKLLESPSPRNYLIRKSKLPTSQANAVLSLLEIKGLICEKLGEVRRTF